MSLVGSGIQVPVKILQDTAAYNSFIVGSVMPFSAETDTGDVVLSRGLVLTVLPVPAYKVCLSCELIQGEVGFGVRPALPLEGVHVIFGNSLAGSCLWAGVLPSPVASLSPTKAGADEDHRELPHVPSACVVTRSMCKAELVSEENDGNVILDVPTLSDFLLVSPDVLMQEQQNDPSLKGAFACVLSADETSSVSNGYVVHDGLLFQKWRSVGDFVSDAIFQLVVPFGI